MLVAYNIKYRKGPAALEAVSDAAPLPSIYFLLCFQDAEEQVADTDIYEG